MPYLSACFSPNPPRNSHMLVVFLFFPYVPPCLLLLLCGFALACPSGAAGCCALDVLRMHAYVSVSRMRVRGPRDLMGVHVCYWFMCIRVKMRLCVSLYVFNVYTYAHSYMSLCVSMCVC